MTRNQVDVQLEICKPPYQKSSWSKNFKVRRLCSLGFSPFPGSRGVSCNKKMQRHLNLADYSWISLCAYKDSQKSPSDSHLPDLRISHSDFFFLCICPIFFLSGLREGSPSSFCCVNPCLSKTLFLSLFNFCILNLYFCRSCLLWWNCSLKDHHFLKQHSLFINPHSYQLLNSIRHWWLLP